MKHRCFASKTSAASASRSAFTLIELLVVIATIAILAAILFPVFAQAREKARQASCESNMKQLALGVTQYIQDYDECYPSQPQCDGTTNYDWQQTWIVNVQPYIKSYGVFACPSDTHTVPINGAPGYTGPMGSYVGNGALGYNWADGTGWGLEGVINSGFTWAISGKPIPSPRTVSQVNFPSSTILVAERWKEPTQTTQIGMFSPWGVLATGADGTENPGGLPGQANGSICGAPVSTSPGLISVGHQGRSNFAFTDGHVKSMLPQQTVNMNPNQGSACNSNATGNNYFYMWSALRTQDQN